MDRKASSQVPIEATAPSIAGSGEMGKRYGGDGRSGGFQPPTFRQRPCWTAARCHRYEAITESGRFGLGQIDLEPSYQISENALRFKKALITLATFVQTRSETNQPGS